MIIEAVQAGSVPLLITPNGTVKCKHIWAFELSLNLRSEVQAQREESLTIEPINVTHLLSGSENIV